jgi:uncharacterized membrane protein YfcA
MTGPDIESMLLIAMAFAIGGILKGATGAGAPLVAVPLLTLIYNVQVAVALFVVPNIFTNLIQLVQYRKSDKKTKFSWTFAIAGFIGAALGTGLLASLSGDTLMLAVALVVLIYIAFRLAHPQWKLDMTWANRLAVPLGTLGGVLQGAVGLSAPISITFLNSIRLDRPQFIATISLFFFLLGFSQLPLQFWYGIMNWERFIQSCLAVFPLIALMPVGAKIGKRLSPVVFDRVILGLLALLSARMIWEFYS